MTDDVRTRAAEVDPSVLSEIGQLSLRARMLADSVFAGMHRSRHHGSSVEFAEHKEYAPGDNLRHLDWRAFARFDRDYIKRFEDEAALRALCVVDCSGSMGYPPAPDGRLSKLDFSRTCAGALAYVLARQGDAVGLATFAHKLDIAIPARARRGHLRELLVHLEALTPSGPSRLDATLGALAEGLRSRTVIIIFSDLLDGGVDALARVASLQARRHDVVLFHVLDPDELEFPFEDTTTFVSMEDRREVKIDARAIREAYLQELARFREAAETRCRSARVEYNLLRSDVSPGRQLADFLAARSRTRASAR